MTPDGYAVNTVFSVNQPHRRDAKGTTGAIKHPEQLLPNQTMPTIGDRLSEKEITWAWYAGGWDKAMAGDPDPKFSGSFSIHHQPFTYFANYADGTAAKSEHLKDEQDFLAALKPTRHCQPWRSSSRSARTTSIPATPRSPAGSSTWPIW